MADKNNQHGMDEDYLPTLQAERDSMDPSYQHATKLLDREIAKVKSGAASEDNKYTELNPMSDVRLSIKVLIPNKAYPKYNFVGKLLGPGGNTMKKLQREAGVQMAVMGRGSMKDKKKEEELRKKGGPKEKHLFDPLHVQINANGPPPKVYKGIADALALITPFMEPQEGEMPVGEMGGMRGGYENGGGEPERVSRGMGGGLGGPVQDRAPYREEPYYQEPAPAPVARGFDDYRPRGADPYDRPTRAEYERVPPIAGGRDLYDRAPAARGDYERIPPASAGGRGVPQARSAAGLPAGRAPPGGARDSYYDFQPQAAQRDRYADQYESRPSGGMGGAASGGSWGGSQGSFKGGAGGAPVRRAVERPHPYQPAGRGAPRF